jgi:hypothetical protein
MISEIIPYNFFVQLLMENATRTSTSAETTSAFSRLGCVTLKTIAVMGLTKATVATHHRDSARL